MDHFVFVSYKRMAKFTGTNRAFVHKNFKCFWLADLKIAVASVFTISIFAAISKRSRRLNSAFFRVWISFKHLSFFRLLMEKHKNLPVQHHSWSRDQIKIINLIRSSEKFSCILLGKIIHPHWHKMSTIETQTTRPRVFREVFFAII